MNSTITDRNEAIDLVSSTLLTRASRLTRLLMREGDRELSRTEAGLLSTLAEGPRRITDLAETEALAQPTVTQLVDKLERRGLVGRERSPEDGRVVLVSLSDDGSRQLESTRDQYRSAMRERVKDLSDEELADLVAASETLRELIESLKRPAVGA